MPKFEEDTNKLKKIITKTQKSAKQAWEAGKILLDIRINYAFKPKYKNFKFYTKEEFNITDNTAEQYIKVHQKIPFDMITDNMLISHLYTIAEMQDDLKNKVLKTMQWAEKNENIQEENIQEENKLPYDGDVILVLKQIVESAKSNHLLSDEILQEIFKEILNQDIKENKRKTRNKKNPLEEAMPIDRLRIHQSFKNVSSIYSHAPISEQGLVGLFCTMFHIIRKKKLDYEKNKYRFSRILYVRTEFPDAKIELEREYEEDKLSIFNSLNMPEDKVIPNYIDIEFELDSFNYWRHKHHEAKEKCDMIICWEIGKTFKEINMPPILSIRELLESGTITLHYSNI